MMIPKIKKILYTTDLSQNSTYVLRYAFNTAEMHDAEINIMHVSEFSVTSFPDSLAIGITPEDKSSILMTIRKRLDDFIQKELGEKERKDKRISTILVAEGNPVVEILKTADELKADVIIMGTHSKGIIAHTFLGSVAAEVLQRSRIPVFIVPFPKVSNM